MSMYWKNEGCMCMVECENVSTGVVADHGLFVGLQYFSASQGMLGRVGF